MDANVLYLWETILDGTMCDLARRLLMRALRTMAETLYPGISAFHFLDCVPIRGALGQPLLDIYMSQTDLPAALLQGLTLTLSQVALLAYISVVHGFKSTSFLKTVSGCFTELIQKLRIARLDEAYWIVHYLGDSYIARFMRLVIFGSVDNPSEAVVRDHQRSLRTKDMVFLELLRQVPKTIADIVHLVRKYRYYNADESSLLIAAYITMLEKFLYVGGLLLGGVFSPRGADRKALYDRSHDIAYVVHNIGYFVWSTLARYALRSYFAGDRVAPHELIGEEFFLQHAATLSYDEAKKMRDSLKSRMYQNVDGEMIGVYISGKRLDYSNETIEYLLDKLILRMENRRRWTRALFRSSVVTKPAEDTCCICLEKYAANDAVIVLPCGHKFHDGELLEWLEKNSECPMCRRKTVARFLPYRKVLAHMLLMVPSVFPLVRIRRADSLLFPRYFMLLLV